MKLTRRRTLGPTRAVAHAFRWLLAPQDEIADEAREWLEQAEASSGSAAVVKCGDSLPWHVGPAARLGAFLGSSPARSAQREGNASVAKALRQLRHWHRYFSSMPAFEASPTVQGLGAAIIELAAFADALGPSPRRRRGAPNTRRADLERSLYAAGLKREPARGLARLIMAREAERLRSGVTSGPAPARELVARQREALAGLRRRLKRSAR